MRLRRRAVLPTALVCLLVCGVLHLLVVQAPAYSDTHASTSAQALQAQALQVQLSSLREALATAQADTATATAAASAAAATAAVAIATAEATAAAATADATAAAAAATTAGAPASTAASNDPAQRCLHLKLTYGVQPGMTWGSLTAEGQAEWQERGCDGMLPANDGEPAPSRSDRPARWWAATPAATPDASANGSSSAGLYEPTWSSLLRYQDQGPPEWYKDAKLGIFFHWGVYSVPAYGESGEWYPKFMYMEGRDEYRHHKETYGTHKAFGYKDFIPHFIAPLFDPDAWASLAQRAGARYIVPVAEHHDGFSMFNSSRNRWNAAAMGPRRDVCKELQRAAAARGLRFGVSSHRAYNWRFFARRKNFD
eukprot:scaffold55970_cov57-Phaeocystis_antarctica.AAC.1